MTYRARPRNRFLAFERLASVHYSRSREATCDFRHGKSRRPESRCARVITVGTKGSRTGIGPLLLFHIYLFPPCWFIVPGRSFPVSATRGLWQWQPSLHVRGSILLCSAKHHSLHQPPILYVCPLHVYTPISSLIDLNIPRFHAIANPGLPFGAHLKPYSLATSPAPASPLAADSRVCASSRPFATSSQLPVAT
ncbi:hypothetical protein VUR80DRAFT_4930 [Thermomyces stellatus]